VALRASGLDGGAAFPAVSASYDYETILQESFGLS
jgi:hypothetical protein